MRAAVYAFALTAAAFAATGCQDYHYFDIKVRFDGTKFAIGSVTGRTDASTVTSCHVSVTGADNKSFDLTACDPQQHTPISGLTVGTFEFSTYADSGQLNFDIKVYNGNGGQSTACLLGEGTHSYPATSTTTYMESSPSDDLVIDMASPGCE